MPSPRIRALLLAGLASLPAGAAQAQLGIADGSAAMNVQADNGIEWQQNQQLYIARGNAVATRGPATIKADTLIAHYRQVKGKGSADGQGNTEIYRVEVDGNVVISRDTRTVIGDHADYDLDQGIGIVRGKALKLTGPTDSVTARDALEWYDEKQIAVARGDAVAVHDNRTIKADVLTAYMVKGGQPATDAAAPPAKPGGTPGKPAAAGAKAAPGAAKTATAPGNTPLSGAGGDETKINRIDAQGHVVVVNGPDIGRGDYGVYNAATNICTLLGNITLTRGADIITGQYAVMDMNTNISRIMPASSLPGSTRQRVQGLFVKQDLSGSGKKAP